ncbi:MAG: hypothetical protein WA871_03055 [Candidatus Acidiferrales bacterium]
MRSIEALRPAQVGHAFLRNTKLRRLLALAARLSLAGIIFLFPAARREFANAQEMAPGPQHQDAQPPATPPSQSPESSAPQPAAAQSPAAESAPEPAPEPFDPAIFQKTVPGDQLTFLSSIDGQQTNVVIRNKAYAKLLRSVVPDCLFHLGTDMPVSGALEFALGGKPVPAQIRDGRYVMVSSLVDMSVKARGFLWIDMQTGIALGGIYFRPYNGEPTPTLTIFSRQVKEKSLEMSQLPPAFVADLAQWSGPAHIPPVETRYFITGSDEKILLAHDEDYCVAAPGYPDPDEDTCEQMNADAADTDMTAAYYLEQTNHIPNSTERTITGDEQVSWIQIRDDTCRADADPLRCHIRMTREHTRVIVHRAAPPPHMPHH